MPRLLALLPCEIAIISKENDTVSLITVMQGITATIPSSALGKSILLPHRWSIFAYWFREEGDDGKQCEQQVQLLSQSGGEIFSQSSTFQMVRPTHSQVGHVLVMPIPDAKEGKQTFTLRVLFRLVGQGQFALAGEFPLDVTLLAAVSETVSP